MENASVRRTVKSCGGCIQLLSDHLCDQYRGTGESGFPPADLIYTLYGDPVASESLL